LFQQFNTGLLKLAKMKVSGKFKLKRRPMQHGEKFTLKLGGIENNRSFVAINISEEDYND
jgi:hypothetical protein